MPKEGFLFKEGHLRKNFKKRWFVLDEGHLKYFEARGALEPIATLVITGAEITSCKVPRPVYYAFRVNTTQQADGHNKYIVAGDSEKESLDWVKALIEEGAKGDILSISVQPKQTKRADFRTRIASTFSLGSSKRLLDDDGGDGTPRAERSETASSLPPGAEVPSLVLAKSTVQQLAESGRIDGDAPFDEVRATLGRERLQSLTGGAPADDSGDDEAAAAPAGGASTITCHRHACSDPAGDVLLPPQHGDTSAAH